MSCMNDWSFVSAAVAALLALALPPGAAAQSRIAGAKSLRCSFALNATGTWKKDGQPAAAATPATLVLIYESIDTDEGTAKLRNGSVTSDVIARSSPGYLHFIQSFRGPLYTTTVFDAETTGGK